MARPTKYDPEQHPIWAEGLAKLGKTEAEIAAEFGVNVDTITNWKKAHKEFLVALKIGKSEADVKVEASLYKRALGYDLDVEETTKYPDGGVQVKKTKKHIAPDTTAQIFWLKNRKPGEWRDKQQTEITGKDGGPVEIVRDMTDEEIEKRAREILERRRNS